MGYESSQHAAGHFCTITKHKLMVMGNCFRVGLYDQDCSTIYQVFLGRI